jgi:hypothetical protein
LEPDAGLGFAGFFGAGLLAIHHTPDQAGQDSRLPNHWLAPIGQKLKISRGEMTFLQVKICFCKQAAFRPHFCSTDFREFLPNSGVTAKSALVNDWRL